MRNSGLIAFTVVVAIFAVIYLGGTVHVRGAPLFHHVDTRLKTTAFMTTYYRMMSILQRKDTQNKKDEWTKTHQDFNKVLQRTVE
jgi:hypothetical protein